ncbi:hypothetical protein M9980_09220 [Sphingomonas donggukensis]|uniref:Uncharacterized protein n=1 Tax=Sphingomonas donggukensis TaxID=2949093 RepID=A0ABY4TS50_9SPHN|nr:hypothetical protein [Sphingomonas donggukensis]URW74754.1 hypothetical protein M9980_09220 [Sphingomonas donggukensis]
MARTRRFARSIAIGAAFLGGAAALVGIFAHRRDWMADELEKAENEVPPAPKV